ncbi:MAG: hypothetical protein ACYSR6_14855 [Planctomycetota bacterium]|jgi:hypothetical protein
MKEMVVTIVAKLGADQYCIEVLNDTLNCIIGAGEVVSIDIKTTDKRKPKKND